jgi:hypothetical protein
MAVFACFCVAAVLDHIVNWDFVLERLRRASQPDKDRKIG